MFAVQSSSRAQAPKPRDIEQLEILTKFMCRRTAALSATSSLEARLLQLEAVIRGPWDGTWSSSLCHAEQRQKDDLRVAAVLRALTAAREVLLFEGEDRDQNYERRAVDAVFASLSEANHQPAQGWDMAHQLVCATSSFLTAIFANVPGLQEGEGWRAASELSAIARPLWSMELE